ncbi:MAG: hypothetical protein EBT45_06940 [Alphaproteobacteria bacterium]|nr:hypothetical protein [Alphaproteobacteria bacterium]
MVKKRTLCIGGLNVDWTAISSLGRFPVDFVSYTFKSTLGGVVHNIAQNLKNLGQEVSIISALGNDAHGELMIQTLQKSGINHQHIAKFDKHPTASIVFVTGPNGEFLLNVARTEIYSLLNSEFFESLLSEMTDFKTWVIDTDLTAEAISFLARHKPKTTKLFGVISAPALAQRVVSVLPSFDGLFMNKEEASRLLKDKIETHEQVLRASDILRSQGILNVFITLDKDGVCVNTTDYRGIISALPARVNDTKGAGDAFASVVIEELASENKKPILEIVHLGLIASSLVVEITGKTYGMLSKDAIKERSKIYE